MDVFTALADPVRRDLLVQLAAGPVRVADLAAARPISRPAVSRHLRVLTQAGLVEAEEHGRERHYLLRRVGLEPVTAYVAPDPALAAERERPGRPRHRGAPRRPRAPALDADRGDRMTAPTGRIEVRDGVHHLVLERSFAAPIDDVWAAVTDPARMARWIGTWTGDPATGRVAFRMLSEGGNADDPGSDTEIRECDPPRRLAVTTRAGPMPWLLELDLSEADGVTTLVFTQPAVDPAEAENVGPGWEYYLDRLVAAETGGDPAAVDFERDYFPATQEHYRARPSAGA